MLVPQTMLLAESVPHTMLSESRSTVPHTMFCPSVVTTIPLPGAVRVQQGLLLLQAKVLAQVLWSNSRCAVTHTMFAARAGSFMSTEVPHTMLVPQTMFCDQARSCPSIVV